MSLTIRISTRPLAAPVLEQCLVRNLPYESWTLHARSPEGRLWCLYLAVEPCTPQVDRLLGAVMANDWLLGLEFDAGRPAAIEASVVFD